MINYSVESVTEGHPDKVADRISDSVLDAILSVDPLGRVACETMVTKDEIILSGEVSFEGEIDYEKVVRDCVSKIGYTEEIWHGFKVRLLLNEQSKDISIGVDTGGAGDQGNMFGYATSETDNFIPESLNLVNNLVKELDGFRRSVPYLRPDGKSQISFNGTEIDTVVLSTHHSKDVSIEFLRKELKQNVIDRHIDSCKEIYINPTGSFVKGGPEADVGLTGRKIMIDSYGPFCRHGGGAFSGKDPTKVDRSGAYAARWVAKNIVAAKLATRCEVQISYVIGIDRPIAIYVNSFGSSTIKDEDIVELIKSKFDLRPSSIIDRLNLRRPIYSNLSSYGHFGREGYSWERLDMVKEILS